MINSKDISVVIQGPVYPGITSKTVASVVALLPESEIVLSTWKNQDLSDIDLSRVILIENEDPGPFDTVITGTPVYSNANRQIRSTKNGLAHATRKYAVKIRSDFIIKNLNFIKRFHKYNERNEYSIFADKIITCSAYTRRMDSIYPYPLHISDLFYFGYTKDIQNLYAVEEYSDDEINYFSKANIKNYTSNRNTKYIIENWFFINLLRKYNKHIEFDSWYDLNQNSIEVTKKVIAGNVVIFSYRQLGIKPMKKSLLKGIQHCYSFPNWFEEYIKYTTPHDKVGFIGFCTILYSKLQRLLYKIKYRKRLKHIRL